MTIAPVSSVLSEFIGGAQPELAMMIGVGLVKDSDAVFFQYLGDEQAPTALTIPTSGRPLTYLRNVELVDISIEEEVGTFKSTKLNVYLRAAGTTSVVMLTSGLTALWSQCVLIALMGMFNSYDLTTPFTLNSWKGTQGLKPCFASIKLAGQKVSDQMLYDQLKDLRSDRDKEGIERVVRDTVEILATALGVGHTEPVDVVVEAPSNDDPAVDF